MLLLSVLSRAGRKVVVVGSSTKAGRLKVSEMEKESDFSCFYQHFSHLVPNASISSKPLPDLPDSLVIFIFSLKTPVFSNTTQFTNTQVFCFSVR